MEKLRTPDECLEKWPGYDFEAHYTDVPDGQGGSLRIHHVEKGPRDAAPSLCLHGQPSWSFLYRKMIPISSSRAASPPRTNPGEGNASRLVCPLSRSSLTQ